MKKFFVMILVIALLMMGCDAGSSTPTEPNTPGQSGGEQTVDPSQSDGGPTRPVEVELIEVDGAAVCVTVTVNPKLELYLDMFNMILDVKAQNEDAEKLLADLQVVGVPYSEGITQILTGAEQQGYLRNKAKLTIETRELIAGGWNSRSEATVLDPIEAYEAASGLTLTCEFYPARKPLDEIISVHTNVRDGYREEICYNAADLHILTRMYFDDGGYWEINWLQQTEYHWDADGSYYYEVWKDGFSSGYTIHPDGTVDREMRTVDNLGNRTDWELILYADDSSLENFYDNNGNLTKSINIYSDGSTWEIFYENGQPVRAVITYADGSTGEDFYENGQLVRAVITNADGSTWETFYENGQPVRAVITYADGSTQEDIYENGQLVRSVITDADGSTQETFYENGQPVRMVITTADGSTQENFYENGQLAQGVGTTADGGTYEQTFYPDGNVKTYIETRGDAYLEQHYDENGQMISLFQRDADGTESDWDYENGEAVGYTVTNPDGSTLVVSLVDGSTLGTNADGSTYEVTRYPNGNLKTNTTTSPNGDYHKVTYYENGNMETDEVLQDGTYRVAYHDENGMLTSTFQRVAEGIETKIEYQNGNIKTDTITWPNGDYQSYTYYENGVHKTQIGMSGGNYHENFYDENGQLTSSFERHSDGTEYDWEYENGEAVGYTVTYPDGSSEYHSYSP